MIIYREYTTCKPILHDVVGVMPPQIGSRIVHHNKLYTVEAVAGVMAVSMKQTDDVPLGHVAGWLVDIRDTEMPATSVREGYAP